MRSKKIYDEILEATNQVYGELLPGRRRKATGALAVEVIRKHLLKAKIPISPRDVYIKGNPTEIDILVPRPGVRPYLGVIYNPEDVIAVLEIKYSGVYSQDSSRNIADTFRALKALNQHMKCVYLTVCENKDLSYRVTSKKLGFQAFTLCWVNSTRTNVKPADEWQAVVDYLGALLK